MDFLNPVGARNPNQISGEGARIDDTEASSEPSNYVEGAEYVPLPSKGVFFNFNPKFVGLDKLKVRQLNYTDEDILTTKSFFDDGSIFFELLKNVIVDENEFPSSALTPVDRDTILLWLRSTAFGNDFTAEINCISCHEKYEVSWDISKFKIPEYKPEVLQELQQFGELSIETPIQNIKVKISVPSIGKTREFDKLLEAKKKARKSKADFFGSGSVLLIVSGVESDGKILRKRSEIESYFNKVNLLLSDARYIRKKYEEINLSYDTKQDAVCPHCQYVQEGVSMPIMHPNFFWKSE